MCFCSCDDFYEWTNASVKDWRMSPHGIAGPPDQSSPNLGNRISVEWPDPYNAARFCRAVTKILRYIRCQKFLTPWEGKLDQISLTSLKTCYGSIPVIVINFMALGQTIYTSNVLQKTLASRGTPWAKVYQSWNWCSATPDLSVCPISSRYDNLCTRYAAKLRWFRCTEWQTNIQTKTVNDKSPATLYMRLRYLANMRLLTYKVLTTTQPPYLHNLISVQPPRNTRSSYHPRSTTNIVTHNWSLLQVCLTMSLESTS